MQKSSNPVIVAYFDGEDLGKVLSNFAESPFKLDGYVYNSVEAFWQSLKTEIPALRSQIAAFHGLDAKRAGKMVTTQGQSLFTYNGNLYKVGSEAHHLLLERALRAKFGQHDKSRTVLLETGNRPLVHAIRNKYGQLRPGDSPALPAVAFERMLTKIRTELQTDTFTPTLNLPKGLNEF
jgi:predicted NAD-dependent protein-ADP-ribosyltransferase YbiA (DUF1768 family)